MLLLKFKVIIKDFMKKHRKKNVFSQIKQFNEYFFKLILLLSKFKAFLKDFKREIILKIRKNNLFLLNLKGFILLKIFSFFHNNYF